MNLTARLIGLEKFLSWHRQERKRLQGAIKASLEFEPFEHDDDCDGFEFCVCGADEATALAKEKILTEALGEFYV